MQIPNDLETIINKITEYGYEVYLIGGSVRDYLLGYKVFDYDLTTSAQTTIIKKILSDYKIDDYREKYGSLKIHSNNNIYDLTTMRIEEGVENKRYPEKIAFTTSLKEDCYRRDFTINAIAYNLKSGYIDYFNGLRDLKNKEIHFIGDSYKRIIEDPIRIIRGLRFSLKLGFKIDINDLKLMNDNSMLISKLGMIRFEELWKILKITGSSEFIKNNINIFKNAYPEINFLLEDNSTYCYRIAMQLDKKYIVDMHMTNIDYRIVMAVKDYVYEMPTIYNIKLKMIKYGDIFANLLKVISSINDDYYQQALTFYEEIVNNNLLVDKKNLKISFDDLNKYDYTSKEKGIILSKLYDMCLKDDSLNEKDKLIFLAQTIIKK